MDGFATSVVGFSVTVLLTDGNGNTLSGLGQQQLGGQKEIRCDERAKVSFSLQIFSLLRKQPLRLLFVASPANPDGRRHSVLSEPFFVLSRYLNSRSAAVPSRNPQQLNGSICG